MIKVALRLQQLFHVLQLPPSSHIYPALAVAVSATNTY